jgi:hypothetical protein
VAIKEEEEVVSAEVAKRRAALLEGDAEARDLYQRLVISGVITAREFWHSREVRFLLALIKRERVRGSIAEHVRGCSSTAHDRGRSTAGFESKAKHARAGC